MRKTSFFARRKYKTVALFFMAFLVLGLLLPVSADSLQVEFERFFGTLEESFTTIANSRVLKKTRLYSMDRFFVSSLRKHQTIYSFIRTNSKGVVISEVIRGQTPERKFRKVRDQRWFRFVQRNQEDYHTLIKIKETGRYYLLWCKPVIKGDKYFVGAVAVKIDLWDCIHKVASNLDEPFLVLLGKKSLYSYRWNDIKTYDKIPLKIPGVKNITLLVQKEKTAEPVVEKPKPETTAVAAAETKEKPQPAAVKEEKPAKKKSFTSSRLFKISLLFGIIIVIILIIVAVSYISRLRQRTLWQKIDEGKL